MKFIYHLVLGIQQLLDINVIFLEQLDSSQHVHDHSCKMGHQPMSHRRIVDDELLFVLHAELSALADISHCDCESVDGADWPIDGNECSA